MRYVQIIENQQNQDIYLYNLSFTSNGINLRVRVGQGRDREELGWGKGGVSEYKNFLP